MKMFKLAPTSLLFGAITLSLSSAAAQQTDVKDVVEAGKKITASANKSQKRVDRISEQIQTKLQQFKALNKEIDGLNVYNQQMQTQVENQQTELAQLAVSMEQVSVIERQVSPLMARMIESLAQFVALDVPFLPEERNNRIEALQRTLTRADVSVSEKFRQVLEAYQVEVDYGRTIEAYTGLQNVAGEERDVDFLRIGRVSLVYRTRDGQHMGMWDQQSESWQPLDASYRTDINKALRIARKQLAPDLIVAPVVQTSAE
ncbi:MULTISPECIES: DUF3450 domain-containing protein [Thalassotalea]|uniref:DUF3450 domain-containing protein n=1 Tax=Thalassotalea TaxID=1518149 RepID=UPI000942D299|nr:MULTISPECIES: DUF3450 domain-containing protein [Thalassotalea]OKY27668.1 hypothetical protein BI291_07950 [Thalassotalea sp. PP2-459]